MDAESIGDVIKNYANNFEKSRADTIKKKFCLNGNIQFWNKY